MLVNILVNILGILVFLFIFWKRLKEDYASEIIFKSASYILLGIGVFSLIAYNFAPRWFLWFEFFGAVAAVAVSIFRFKTKFYEVLESLIISSLPWLSFIFLKDSVANSSLSSFLAFLVVLVAVFVFYYFDQHYRQFVWYKSGKVGFAGLSTLALIFLVRAALAVLETDVISFVDKYEVAFSATATFLCFLMIFNLGRVRK